MEVNHILYSLLRMKKGPEHVILINNSHLLSAREKRSLSKKLIAKITRLNIGYILFFYMRGPALVCYWDFKDYSKIDLKKWFDENAKHGIYPEIPRFTL